MLNLHDKSLLNRDEAIEGLQYLLQPELLLQALSGHLDTGVLANARTTYLRYKPGVNCIARIDFKDGTAYAKAFGENADIKLEKARQRSEIPGPAGPGRVFLDEAGIIFSFFPNDAELTSLARLENPATRANFLARIFKSEPGWDDALYTPLNYKPERRFVAKFTNCKGRSATVKFFTKKGFAAIRNSRKKLNLPDGLTMPEWIGGSKSHRIMAFAWLPGDTLYSKLQSGCIDESRQAGEAIARLHLSQQPALKGGKNKYQLAILDSLASQLGYLMPDISHYADELVRTLGRWWSGRTPERKPVHGDFYDKQIIIKRAQVGIIDIDSAHLGDPVNDLGCFVAHLERRAIEGLLNTTQVDEVKAGLLSGYYSVSPGTDLHELDTFTALNLFQLTHHPFRDRRAGWPEETASLLDRCKQLVKNTVRR